MKASTSSSFIASTKLQLPSPQVLPSAEWIWAVYLRNDLCVPDTRGMLTCENFCQTLQFWHSGKNPHWLKTWPLMAPGRGLVGKPWLLSRATTLGRPQGWQQGNSGAHVPTGSDSHGERGGCRVSSHLVCPGTPWGMRPFCARILAAHHHPPANTQPFAVMRLLADNQAPKTSLLHKHKKLRAIIHGVWRRRQFLINV